MKRTWKKPNPEEQEKKTDRIIQDIYKKFAEGIKTGTWKKAIKRPVRINADLHEEEIPKSFNYSLMNRIMVMLSDSSGTGIAGTFKWWTGRGRSVKKGEKAFYITAPNMKPHITEKINKETGETEKIKGYHFAGTFRYMPIFSLDQTEGKTLRYMEAQEEAQEKIQTLPLMNIARELNLKVIPDLQERSSYGSFNLEDTIRLSSYSSFFHELAHAIDGKLLQEKGKKLKPIQDPIQEITAEFCSMALQELTGQEEKKDQEYSWKYLLTYSENDEKKAIENLMTAMPRIEGILKYIEEREEIAK